MSCDDATPVVALRVDQGDTPTLAISVNVADGAAFNPVGAEGVFIAAKSAGAANPGPDVFFTKSTSGGSPTASFDTVDGVVVLKVPLLRVDTNAIAPGKYHYEAIILESAGSVRSHIVKGPLYISQVVGK